MSTLESIRKIREWLPKKRKLFHLLLFSFFTLYPTHTAHADLVPPTTFTFEFHSKIDSPIEIIAIEFHTCSDLRCSQQSDPYTAQCDGNVCQTWIYPIMDYEYAQVVGTFRDEKQCASAVFVQPDWIYFGIQLTYDVFVYEDGMKVFPIPYQGDTPHFGFAKANLMLVFGAFTLMPALIITKPQKQTTSERNIAKDILITIFWLFTTPFFLLLCAAFWPIRKLLFEAALLTLIIECGLSIVYAAIYKLPKMHFLTIILIANITSIALLQFILSTGLHLFQPALLAISELLVWILEALIISILGRWTLKLSLRETILISLINNACSLGVGFLLYR